MPYNRRTRLALIGAGAKALRGQLIAAGVEISDDPGAAALIDLQETAEVVAAARTSHSLLLGLAAPDAPAETRVDAMVRSAADVPQLLSLLGAAQEDARRKDSDLEALVDVTAALARGGDPEQLLAHVVARIAGRLTVERCSLVLIEADGTGSVVVASDDAQAGGKRIDLVL
ncbi:MAG TPA: hypothetical protein VH083_04775, partial [Myxococcales bacterium]|nr:hypothetical protein [Myxococcales bacterium]